MTSGVEPELSVVIDVFFPTSVISSVAKAFVTQFPLTPLRLFVEGLGAAYQPVLDGRCSLGILPPLPRAFPSLVSERLGELPLIAVASATHSLASFNKRIPRHELAKHVQLVLTDRSELTSGHDFGVASTSTWRLADLSTKHAFLKDGVGWGGMPAYGRKRYRCRHVGRSGCRRDATYWLDVNNVRISPTIATTWTCRSMVRRPLEDVVAVT